MTSQRADAYLLAGDIGGTKTTLALYDFRQGPLVPLAETTVQNESATGLADIIDTFLGEQHLRPECACFGVAGPVIGNRVRMTNLDWILDGQVLRQRFRMRSVTLINDLVATAMGAVQLPPESLFTLNDGQPDSEGAIAVIAPGTGLGQAFLVRERGRLLPFPSEGGHCSFAPVDDQQIRLLQFMLKRRKHVSTERVCSGIGIPNLYDFLRSELHTPHEPDTGLPTSGDHTAAIVQAALAARNKTGSGESTAVQAVELFTVLLASEAANLVLKVLATGGLFIGGGLSLRLLPYLKGETFMQHFCKGVYRDMLADIPVHVILEPKSALIGAAAYALTYNQRGDVR